MATPEITPSVVARFWKHVDKSGDCWVWRAGLLRNRYGSLQIGRRPWPAHRVSWAIHNGPIPDGLVVRHACDNPPCVRPDHLSLGTQRDNMADQLARGRRPTSYDFLMNLGQAAIDLGVSRATLRQQIARGKLAGFKSAEWHVRRSEVERYRRDHAAASK